MTATVMVTAAAVLGGCSGSHPVPTGPVSTPNAGKAAFNESKAIEKIYQAGFTNISLMTRDRDDVWRGQAIRRSTGAKVIVSVTQDGAVVSR